MLVLLLCGGAAEPPAATPPADDPPSFVLPRVVRRVAFSRDGQRLVGTHSFVSEVRDVATGQVIATIRSDRDVVAAALDGPGRRLLAATRTTARLLDVETGKVLQHFPHARHGEGMHTCALDATEQRVLTAGGSVRVWDVATRRQVFVAQHAKRLFSAEFAAGDSRILAVVYETAEDKSRRRPPGPGFTYNGSQGQVLIWDVESGRLLTDDPAIDSGQDAFSPDAVFRLAALSADGRVLANLPSEGLRLTDLATGRRTELENAEPEFGPPPRGSPDYLTYHPDGKRLLTLDLDGAILWEPELKNPAVLENSRGWRTAGFSGDGRRVLLASWWTGVAVVDASSRKVVFRRPPVRDPREKDNFFAVISPDGHHVAVRDGSHDGIAVWRLPREP